MHIPKPLEGEFTPYFSTYINKVEEGDYHQMLASNTNEIKNYFEDLPKEKIEYRYAENKWSIKEVLIHIIDVERVMLNRAFVASKLDSKTVLMPMNDEYYVKNSNSNGRTIEGLLEEFQILRQLTSVTFRDMNEIQLEFKANNNGNPITARALAYIILGHAKHHLGVLKNLYR